MTPEAPAGPTCDLDAARFASGAQRFSHAAMATVFEVHCVHADARYAAQAARAAFAVVDQLEQLLSRFIGNSDIARINLLAAGQDTRVSPSTMECLEIAWRLCDLTGGAFDVSLGSSRLVSSTRGRDPARGSGSGSEHLELLPEELTVRAREGGARLDLGGIGKGYAVDRAAAVLEEWEIPQALVHGGFSSVLALDPPAGRDGWPLTLSAPGSGDGRVLARVPARRKALSASGLQKGDHILDPRSGLPVRDRTAAWVAIPWEDGAFPAAVADALSTAFMVQAVEEIAGLCQACPGVEAWVLPGPSRDGGPTPTLVHMGGPRP